MDMDAVGHLPAELVHGRRQGGEVDRNMRVVDRARIEEGREEIVAVEAASEPEPVLTLERPPDVTEGSDQLAELRGGRLERHREAPYVVRLDLRSKTEYEAACARTLEIPGEHRGHHRAAGERRRDAGAQKQLSRRQGGRSQTEKGVVTGLGGPEAVVAEPLDLGRQTGDLVDAGRDHYVALHTLFAIRSVYSPEPARAALTSMKYQPLL